MNTTRHAKSKTERRVVLVLIASALLCGSIFWLLPDARSTKLTAPIAPARAALPPPVVVTQHVTDGAFFISQALGVSLITNTQFTSPEIEIKIPTRYYFVKRISKAQLPLQSPNVPDTLSLSLIDTRYTVPTVDLE